MEIEQCEEKVLMENILFSSNFNCLLVGNFIIYQDSVIKNYVGFNIDNDLYCLSHWKLFVNYSSLGGIKNSFEIFILFFKYCSLRNNCSYQVLLMTVCSIQ